MRPREPQLLKDKAIASMRRMVSNFNSLNDEGRQTNVMLAMQHAFEMLLKAGLREKRVGVFDKATRRSFGFDKCVRLAASRLSLSDENAGVLRAIDALRDEEQHWLATVSEGILYVHARAGVTLFDELLQTYFGERLASYLPERVLPISTSLQADIDVLIDEQYKQIRQLLRPGKRRRLEARSMVRGLLALEGHVSEDAAVSEADVDRVEHAIRGGADIIRVFPRLTNLHTTYEGEGPAVKVHFTKQEGALVTFVPADDPQDAAAVREVDLQRKYYIAPNDLAKRVGLTAPRGVALRRHLDIEADKDCFHVFPFGSQKHPRYSDNALRRMEEALKTVDMNDVWAQHGPRRRGKG